MKYKVLLAGTAHYIKIKAEHYKNWKVWRIQFDNGKKATLVKMGNEWMQRHEDFLDKSALITIGQFIDRMILNTNPAISI